jgi:hypothetical protein
VRLIGARIVVNLDRDARAMKGGASRVSRPT